MRDNEREKQERVKQLKDKRQVFDAPEHSYVELLVTTVL